MARKGRSTSENGKLSMGTIVTVAVFLWLGGLTFLWWSLAGQGGGGDLEQRVARLEAKASRVVKKIKVPGSASSPKLEARIQHLEQKLGALSGSIAAASAENASAESASAKSVSTEAAVVHADCNCEGLTERMDRLEGLVVARADNSKKDNLLLARSAAPVADVSPVAETVTAPVKKTKKRIRRANVTPRKKKAAPAKWQPVKKRSAEPATSVKPANNAYHTRGDHQFIDDKNRIYGAGGQSVYEMTRKFGPMVGDSLEREKSVRSLAPGAGVYPYGGSTYH